MSVANKLTSRPGAASDVNGTQAHAAGSGQHQWPLLIGLAVVFFTLLALYCAVLSVLLPNQIEMIDRANKASDLALVFAITSVFSTLTTPIAGALSDRTRTRWGRRTPWIVAGSIGGALCLAAVSQMTELWSITVFWVGATITLNGMQAALTTVVADRFPPHERGKVSGFVGGGMTAGGTAGIVLAGHLAFAVEAARLLDLTQQRHIRLKRRPFTAEEEFVKVGG